jgi:predicted sulfurtransferase
MKTDDARASPVSRENAQERKRRLSRKDQKARKKQKRRDASSSFDTSTKVLSKSPTQDTDYLANYQPIDIPQSSKTDTASSLGKWFPTAKVIKSPISYSNTTKTKARASILLFYQYADWPESKVSHILTYLARIAEKRTIGGRIRLAPEGVNATVSSVDCADVTSHATLRHFCEDLKRFDPVFGQTDFKFIDGIAPDRHFKDLKLLPVKELVFYGIRELDAPLEKGGTHLPAKEFHQMLEKEQTVVIDVRNHYEAAIGRFNGQDAAEYIDPLMRRSTDFVGWLEKPETQRKLQNKTVLMYCTGGVRCERASAYLNCKIGDQVNGVYQLQGGIEKYLQEFPDGGHWRGKNFVFDKREAISADNHNGDGGVITRNSKDAKVETRCCLCSAPWDRYVGKKKCTMCGVPVLMCDACMSKSKSIKIVARCPLCVEQDITVPAHDAEYTENGTAARYEGGGGDEGEARVAPSVLKWGGGHAHEKKQRLKEKRRVNKLKSRVCRFGRDCTREDCFFYHPGLDDESPPEDCDQKCSESIE